VRSRDSLRDGRNIVTQSLATLNRLDLVCHMLGRKPDEVSKESRRSRDGRKRGRSASAAAGGSLKYQNHSTAS